MKRLLFFIIPLLFAGCQKDPLPAKPKQLRLNFITSPLSSDPRKKSDPITSVFSRMVYEGLTHLEPDGTITPALAEDVAISDDGTIYTFYLREGKWSDGRPITARDFELSWKRLLSKEFPSGCADILYPIKNGRLIKAGKLPPDALGVEAISDRILRVELELPAPYFLELTAFCTCFAVPDGIDRDTIMETVASGPFYVDEWRHDDKIILKKNPYYRRVDEIKIDSIEVSLIKDESTALALYDQGEIDYVGGMVSPLPIDAIPTAKNRPDFSHKKTAGTTFIAFNLNRFPFTNGNIRKAFSYAINRQEIIDNITQMEEEVATGPVCPILKQFRRREFFSPYDPQLAKRHFKIGCKELGIDPDHFPTVTYNYFMSELQGKVAAAIQGQWLNVLGVKVRLKQTDLKIYHSMLHDRDFDLAQMSWIAQYPDQMNFLERFQFKTSSRNYSSWENSRFQELLKKAQYAHQKEDRFTLLETAETLLMEDMPIAPLYHYNSCFLESPRLHDVETSPLGEIQFHRAYLQ